MSDSPDPTSSATTAAGQDASPANEGAGKRILVVEDEETLALGVQDALSHAGYVVDVVLDGTKAVETLAANSFDLVILDLMLPGTNGLDVLKILRGDDQTTRVVVLTALADESDILRGFELGADDYMAKPFSPKELVARVDAQFRRRTQESNAPQSLELPGGIVVDLARLEVHRDGEVTALTPREGDILDYLVKNRDRVVTREDLLLDVWHYRNPNVATRTVDIHIVGLRRKVEPDPSNPSLIQTVRGKGYRWFDG